MSLSILLLLLVMQKSSRASFELGSTVPAEQAEFSTEGEVVHNIALPPVIRKLLEQDSFVQETLRAESPSKPLLPESWTECSLIHLGDIAERDYIVVGQHQLTGAHATHFWVYRETPKGMKLVLFAFADSLRVEQRRTRGLRVISTLYYTAINDGEIQYFYDGDRYRTRRLPQYR